MASLFILLGLSLFLTAESTCLPKPPACKDPNEVYIKNPTKCDEYCNPADAPKGGDVKCGCYCREGYKRNAIGKCIKGSDCNPPKCKECKDPNSWWDSCTWYGAKAPCPPQNCSRTYIKVDCTKVCWKCEPQCRCKGDLVWINNRCLPVGACFCKENEVWDEKANCCVCKKGYKKDAKGNCVKESHCSCKENEVWDEKANCCVCKKGYKKDAKGNCKKESHCPCKENEVWDEKANCCVCKKGYKKDAKGNCVKENHCQCKENEVWKENTNDCEKFCKTLGTTDDGGVGACAPTSGCFCEDGYRRDANGKCIRECNCPLTCPTNEEWDPCPDYYPKEECSTKDPDFKCPKLHRKWPCPKGRCICVKGYRRNAFGVCLPENMCPGEPPQCGPNKSYSECGSPCPDSCSNLDDPDRICPDVCVEGCFCNMGYVLNERGDCVTPDKCGVNQNCGKNEIGKDCRRTCPAQTCAARLALIKCPGNPPCIPGCDCKPNYLRNAAGDCIPSTECDKPSTDCGIMEEWDDCGTKCERTCKNKDDIIRCEAVCKAGCFCLPEYVRSDSGRCVLKDHCVKRTNCNKTNHEVYNKCGSACPNTCSSFNNDRPCTRQCVEGCFCEEGYVRDKYGRCIKPEECKPRIYCDVKKHEIYLECGSACPDDCDNYGQGVGCGAQCVEGCFCQKGYLRNPKGECVKPGQCPGSENCNENEIFTKCKQPCPPQNCSIMYTTYNCGPQPPCKPGCICLNGYLRDDKTGKCIPTDQCGNAPTQCTGDNEEYQECGTACPRTCRNLGALIKCTANCVAGCFCKAGFVRNDQGLCVKPEQCPPKCDASNNEEFRDCGSACPDTCENGGKPGPCTLQCVPGCYCKKGFLRRKDGRCVLPEQCPQRCGPNEIFAPCRYICPPQSCEAPYTDYACPNPVPCEPGCNCIKDYVRDLNGVCIHADQCPLPGDPPKCPINEVYNECGTACPKTCKNKDIKIKCVDRCVKGCFCKDGYVRNDQKVCVRPEKCPRICDANNHEVLLECGSSCPDTCENAGKPRICTMQCVRGCFCEKGYLRRSDGRCVRPEQCPPKCDSSNNEEYLECGSACPDTCENGGKPGLCTAQCVPGCFCKEGYLRHKDGRCVLPKQCPPIKCRRKNEVYKDCGTACPVTCRNKDFQSVMGQCIQKCVRGCFCEVGYVRNEDSGECVRAEECSPRECPKNERYVYCVIGECIPKHCSDQGKSLPCPRPIPPCEGGCLCIEGYLRHANGTCIPKRQCPSRCDASNNEEFLECGSACPDTCENGGKPRVCTLQCVQGCFCKKGFLRRGDGRCVLPKQCPPNKCSRKNEVYKDCGTACPITCKNKDHQGNMGNCIQKCVRGCFCEVGYVRDQDSGECVKPEDCPNQCGKNEVFLNCGTACPLTCDKPEPRPCTKNCVRGCFCKSGYVRDAKNNCILKEKCPKGCGGVPNAIPGCQNCHETCEGYRYPFLRPECPPDVDCDKKCKCAPGYVRDDEKGGICVIPERCSNINCRPDQVYSRCAWSCSTWDNCPEDDTPRRQCSPPFVCHGGCACPIGYLIDRETGRCIPAINCPVQKCKRPNEEWHKCVMPWVSDYCNEENKSVDLLPKDCYPRCLCKKNFCRNKKGICEPKAPKQCPKNEVYNTCGTACPKTCKNKDIQINCIALCVEGCFCIDGYVRNAEGKCVDPKECPPPKCTGKNEEYQECGTACPRTCRNLGALIKCTANCVAGCFCKAGFVRNDQGLCVKPEECPPKKCTGKNEEYQECGTACPKTCQNKDLQINCIALCVEGCFCMKGYVRNDEGKCVDPKECPKCPANEWWDSCPSGAKEPCPPQTCHKIHIRINCQAEEWQKNCTKQCRCVGDLVRNDQGKCVPIEECSTQRCIGDNEVYVDCVIKECYKWKRCSDIGRTMPCSNETLPCTGGCLCKDGYLRDENALCILQDQCPKKCPRAHERYVECVAGYCIPKACEDIDQPIACPDIIGPCPGGCICEEKYLRNSTGDCIPEDQCPRCPENSHFERCKPYCVVETCKQRENPPVCIPEHECVPGCVCNEGYLKDEKGNCVICPACRDDFNATQGCQDCRRTCESIWNPPRRPLPDCPSVKGCEKYCKCLPDYVKDEALGICVRPEDCSNRGCEPNQRFDECAFNCSTRDYCPIDNTPPTDCSPPFVCNPGCVCKPGFLIDNVSQKCILASDCPSVLNCGKNEVATKCVQPCLDESCKNVGVPPKPCPIKMRCTPKCICKENYCRDENKQCVPYPKPPVCPKNEQYFDCVIGQCNEKHCSDQGKALSCPRPVLPCAGGCLCIEGYLRHDNGTCIPKSQCPKPHCKENEKYVDCVLGECKWKFCRDIGKPIACPGILYPCQGGCICKDGYLRRDDGKCIPQDKCNHTCTDPNSEPGCQTCTETCKYLEHGAHLKCASKPCSDNDCKCKEGFYKDEAKGICVRPDQCSNFNCTYPKVFARCAFICDSDYCPKGDQPPPNCLLPNVCNAGCKCRFDHRIDRATGECILSENCPKKCNDNEVWVDCLKGLCTPITCEDLDKPNYCPLIHPPCAGGCACKKGYLRNFKGLCIPQEDCPCNGDPNAIRKRCPNYCPPTCDNPNPGPCPKICLVEGCECKEGFVNNTQIGLCVTIDKCPAKPGTCPPGEVYQECGPSKDCVKTCANRGAVGNCIQKCTKGCFCPDNYYRNDKGKCVKYEDCTCNNDPNTTPGCGTHCGNTCDDHGPNPDRKCPIGCSLLGCNCKKGYVYNRLTKRCVKPEHCTCPKNETHTFCYYPCPGQKCENAGKVYHCPFQNETNCRQGCVCLKGYYRNATRKCVLQKDCGCGENEEYSDCYYTCHLRTCDNIGKKFHCPLQTKDNCLKGCICKKGYVRDPQNRCIKENECPTKGCKGDPNAIPGRGNHCGKSCSDYKTPTKCPRFWVIGSCDCKEGYVYDDVLTKKCVLPKDCPCPNNETYSDCYFSCPSRTCDNYKKRIYCKPQSKANCLKGCVCLPGYLRDSKGNCIDQNECPRQCPANETYSDCLNSCSPQTCVDIMNEDKIAPCPPQDKANCQKGCVCLEGYVRDAKGRCIRKEDCPKPVCPANEVYSNCAAALCTPRTCAEVGGPILCPVVALPCPGGCVCREGWVRNEEKVCVPPEQCPKPACPPGEVYKACGSACVATCANRGNPGMCTDGCVAGCFCPDGMYRNDDNKCVQFEECTCNDDPNTRPGCGIHCGNTCADHGENAMRLCPPAACNLFGCDCREGFLLDELTGKCVRLEDCSKPCPPNQTYARCAMRCLTDYCPKNSGPFPICDPQRPCPGGCVCKQGFKLDPNSKEKRCIHVSECPPVACKNKNEVFSFCPRLCHDDSCRGKDAPKQDCGTGCGRMRCICKPGFYRNDAGECIPEHQCPSKCPANETYNLCVYNCPPRICAARGRAYPCPNPSCAPGCQCNDGYLRNDNNDCVLEKDCPNNTCPAGEIYKECGTSCPGTCVNGGRPTACTDRCMTGCFCPDGLVRDGNGRCIKLEDCPGCRGDPNADLVKCVDPCSPTCEYPNPTPCPTDCKEGCQCKKGFVKGPDKKCIKLEDCPDCHENQTYADCAFFCPTNDCLEDDGPVPQCRPPPPQYCNGGCKCLPGYLRDRTSEKLRCVKSYDCRPIECTRVNEIYSSCSSPCLNEQCSEKDVPQPACDSGECGAPRCICKPGHLRNSNDDCVPIEDCFKTCPSGEIYKECGTACPGTCANLGRPPYCTDQCVAGCFCPDGLVRDENGRCIKLEECSGCGGDHNADLVKCPDPCAPTCMNRNRTACPRDCDEPGCQCKEGFVKGPDKKCIKLEACPVCAENQTYVDCAWFCPSFSDCPKYDGPLPQCMPPLLEYCNGGCICKPGYKRDRDSETLRCIKSSDCPPIPCRGENKTFSSCPSPCLNERCSKLNTPQTLCHSDGCGNPQCVCKPGYLRNDNDDCVAISECPQKCPAGEIYQECGTACPGTCDNGGRPPVCTEQCVAGCFCPDGQVRDDNGKCIELKDCPNECPEGEVYQECGTACPGTCANGGRRPVCTEQCVAGCFCPDGQVRDDNGKCIEVKDCPNECPEGEVYQECGTACPGTCANGGRPPVCTEQCVAGCFCPDGQVRDDNGKCIELKDCPNECPEGEVYQECGTACPGTCANGGRPLFCTEQCVAGCFCPDGQVRDDNGKCIELKDCPGCRGDPNADLVDCPDPCAQSCQFPNRPPCPRVCNEPGCQCKEGFVKGPDKKCIKLENCPKCDANQTYVDCVFVCDPPDYCPLNDQGSQVACGAPALEYCTGGCACIPGYKIQRYTKKLRCIKSSDCPEFECTRKNEIFERCPPVWLDERCSQKDVPKPSHDGCADPRCVCLPGYYRNDNGECVPAGDCPPPKCPANETYGCVDMCSPRTCESRGRVYDCAYAACTPGCQCNKGYLRNSDNICVLEKDCPLPKCPANETYGCVDVCPPRTCEARDRVYRCPYIPCTPGCQCNKGYLRNSDKVCVLEKDCPPKCPVNEEYTDYYECPPKTCAAIFRQYRCREQKLVKGCTCIRGYSRNDQGACIPSHKCPNAKCPPNETFADCKVECPISRCPTDDGPIPECLPSPNCRPGCVCSFNYRRDVNGRCIPASECPPVNCTGQNQVYDPCPSPCLSEGCASKDDQPSTCNTFAPVACMPRCVCAEDHFRNDNNDCVPYDECPKKCDDPNAEYVKCPNPCPPTCDNPRVIHCFKICKKYGCQCKKGYVIGPNGKCIKLCYCPCKGSCKDPNAEYIKNPHPCPGNCDHPDPFPCKKPCKRCGCQCKKGYVVGPKGNCIEISDCPCKGAPPVDTVPTEPKACDLPKAGGFSSAIAEASSFTTTGGEEGTHAIADAEAEAFAIGNGGDTSAFSNAGAEALAIGNGGDTSAFSNAGAEALAIGNGGDTSAFSNAQAEVLASGYGRDTSAISIANAKALAIRNGGDTRAFSHAQAEALAIGNGGDTSAFSNAGAEAFAIGNGGDTSAFSNAGAEALAIGNGGDTSAFSNADAEALAIGNGGDTSAFSNAGAKAFAIGNDGYANSFAAAESHALAGSSGPNCAGDEGTHSLSFANAEAKSFTSADGDGDASASAFAKSFATADGANAESFAAADSFASAASPGPPNNCGCDGGW